MRQKLMAICVTGILGVVAFVTPATTSIVPAQGAARGVAPAVSSGPHVKASVRKVQNHCFQNGSWHYGISGSSQDGTMVIQVHGTGKNARHLTGSYHSYDWVTKGHIDGMLTSPCGHVWHGRFTDHSTPWNEGPFTATFSRSHPATFGGWFKTHDGCNFVSNLISQCKYGWSGTKY